MTIPAEMLQIFRFIVPLFVGAYIWLRGCLYILFFFLGGAVCPYLSGASTVIGAPPPVPPLPPPVREAITAVSWFAPLSMAIVWPALRPNPSATGLHACWRPRPSSRSSLVIGFTGHCESTNIEFRRHGPQPDEYGGNGPEAVALAERLRNSQGLANRRSSTRSGTAYVEASRFPEASDVARGPCISPAKTETKLWPLRLRREIETVRQSRTLPATQFAARARPEPSALLLMKIARRNFLQAALGMPMGAAFA